jgi:uncharacterized protein YdbL (DUF1318 family)
MNFSKPGLNPDIEVSAMKRSYTQIASQPLPIGLLIFALAFILAPAAGAGTLDDYKASLQVGEQLDGYVGIVTKSPSAEINSTVADINKKRKDKYAGIAKERGITLSQVEALAGG